MSLPRNNVAQAMVMGQDVGIKLIPFLYRKPCPRIKVFLAPGVYRSQ